MTPDPLLLLLAVLGCYRLAYMVAMETGPFAIFERVRSWAFNNAPTWIGEGLGCPLCISFWLALPFAFAIFPLVVPLLLIGWWGIAGATLLIHLVLRAPA